MYQLEGDFKGLEVIRSGSSLNLRIIFEMFLMGIFSKFSKMFEFSVQIEEFLMRIILAGSFCGRLDLKGLK